MVKHTLLALLLSFYQFVANPAAQVATLGHPYPLNLDGSLTGGMQ